MMSKPFGIIVAFALLQGEAAEISPSIDQTVELRRIAEYWNEKDYRSARLHIQDFLIRYPSHSQADHLHAMLGDLHFLKNQYKEAISNYEAIQSKEVKRECQFRYLHSLYCQKEYQSFLALAPLALKDPHRTGEEIDALRLNFGEASYQLGLSLEGKEQKDLLQQALSSYQQLMQTKYGDSTLLHQAHIYTLLENYPKAASLYLLLAQNQKEKKEIYLFQAGSLQKHFDKKGAISMFKHLCELQGETAGKAAFNHLILTFEEKSYRDFILSHDKLSHHLPKELFPIIQYYLGRALFAEKDYPHAVNALTAALASDKIDRSQRKSALLGIAASAKELNRFSLFENALEQMQKEFVNDKELIHLFQIHIEWAKEEQLFAKARESISYLLNNTHDFTLKESLLYDQMLLFSKEKNWEESALIAQELLHIYQKGHRQADLLRHLIRCRFEDQIAASSETEKIKKELFLESLLIGVAHSKNLEIQEREKLLFTLGKTQFELSQFSHAIHTLNQCLVDFPNNAFLADAHLLIALCYQKGMEDHAQFAAHAEQAILFHSDQTPGLHLSLYNTYLTLATLAAEEDKPGLVEKAAYHLFCALDHVKQDQNRHWLANYYYQKYKQDKKYLEKATSALEQLFSKEEIRRFSIGKEEDVEGNLPLSIDGKSMELEIEAVRLAELYGESQEQSIKKLLILKALHKTQLASPSLGWKHQRMVLFEMGKAYAKRNQYQEAIALFDDLISNAPHAPSYYAIAAQLEKIKLQFEKLKIEEKREESTEIRQILDTLKQIQIQRSLCAEPLYLEAALTYIDIKVASTPTREQSLHKQHLLTQMKANFSSLEDPLVQQYLSVKSEFPQKMELFKQYMDFIDAEVQLLEGLKTTDKGSLHHVWSVLNRLESQSTEETLILRISKSKESLEKVL